MEIFARWSVNEIFIDARVDRRRAVDARVEAPEALPYNAPPYASATPHSPP